MEVPRHWRMRQQRYALAGATCNHCGIQNFPPRPVCPQCGGVRGQDLILGRKQEAIGLPIQVEEPVAFPQRGG